MKFLEDQIRELESLKVPKTARKDFDAFWKRNLKEVEGKRLNVKSRKVEYPIKAMDVSELSYEGLDGTRISALSVFPKGAKGKVPAIVFFHGANGNKGTPEAYAKWTLMGVGAVAIDFRLQSGESGMGGEGFASGSGFVNSYMTYGVLERDGSYIRHIYTDALLALRLARETEGVDAKRVGVCGGSQGGAMALATAALDKEVSLCVASVPSNCWMERRIFMRSGIYGTIAQLIKARPELADRICGNLSYFDNLNLSERIKCPTLVGVGLNDPVCPPDTIYAACNRIKAPKRVIPYPFTEHDGNWPLFNLEALSFVERSFFKGGRPG